MTLSSEGARHTVSIIKVVLCDIALRIAYVISNSAYVAKLDALLSLTHEALRAYQAVPCVKTMFLIVALRLAGIIPNLVELALLNALESDFLKAFWTYQAVASVI
jgi:hypothetical protein